MDNGLNILVVDDDEKVGKMFTDLFSDEGHSVCSVTTGEEAVTRYQKDPYHMVFLDMILPGMNGLETLKKLKNIDVNVRVVLMTGYSVLGMLEDASKVGIITTLIKPFHLDQVKSALDQSITKPAEVPRKRTNSALIIDEWMGLAKKLDPLFTSLDFEVHLCKGVQGIQGALKDKEFDLIIISTSALEKNTMQTFYYMKKTMPMSKCIMLVDEHMNIEEISENIREMFRI